MPKYIIVENNLVTNVIEAPDVNIATFLVSNNAIVIEQLTSFSSVGIGHTYTGIGAIPFILPNETAIPIDIPKPWLWYIDVGPFFDRFGAFKIPILISTDPGVKALITDLQIRKWVDLQNDQVAQGLAYISTVIPSFTSDIRLQILTTPVSLEENMALRKLYFN